MGTGEGGYAAVLARMAPDKGIHRAIAIARAAGVPLRIAAKMREPNERRYFEQYVEPELSDDIQYLGELDHAAKCALLADAVALLNPITWPEPFGMAMVEAMACGTPVVGCPRGAAPEIVDQGVTGHLSDDDAELVHGLRTVGRLDRRDCRRRVEEHFSVEQMVAGHLRVYEQHIASQGRPAAP
jgi:glycosyltransferase involved in cell wall biosynthesis